MTYIPSNTSSTANTLALRDSSGAVNGADGSTVGSITIAAGLLSGATGTSARRDEYSGIITTTNATPTLIKSVTFPANCCGVIGVIVMGIDTTTKNTCIFGYNVDIQAGSSTITTSNFATRDPNIQGSTIGSNISFSSSGLILSTNVIGVISTTIKWSCWLDILSLTAA